MGRESKVSRHLYYLVILLPAYLFTAMMSRQICDGMRALTPIIEGHLTPLC